MTPKNHTMVIGNVLGTLLSVLGFFSMTTDDFGPYKIWFTLPGVFLIVLIGGFFGDYLQAKWKKKHDSRAIG